MVIMVVPGNLEVPVAVPPCRLLRPPRCMGPNVRRVHDLGESSVSTMAADPHSSKDCPREAFGVWN